jgi:4-methylaminobutanoate oxidase (formaldehyde-forming)
MLWGGELILRDGIAAGQVMSAAWGETLGACVGLAYIAAPEGRTVSPDYLRTGSYQVNVGGELVPARVTLKAPREAATSPPS